jgi:hypothetical protein
MSLFSQLRRLYRTDRFLIEDPHTEIVAQVLRNSDALTLEWLGRIGATTLEKAKINIATQKTFGKLDGHSSASRPDITIHLSADGKNELIFVESKLPSTQGYNQLQRYADHLAAEQQSKALTKASLVFITLNYEAATAPKVANSQYQPTFYPTRWFKFYQHLKAHVNGDGLARELKLFMEENRMSLGNQFRSTDLVALENFVSAQSLMDETLDGEVNQAASKVFAKVKSSKGFEDMRIDPRYVLHFGNWQSGLVVLIGYWLPHENPDAPVRVGITIYSNPLSTVRMDVIELFRSWSIGAGGQWIAGGLDDENSWVTLHKRKALQALMGEVDHVRAIKDYLLALVKEVEAFRKTSSKLPWSLICGSDANGADDDGSAGIPVPPETHPAESLPLLEA